MQVIYQFRGTTVGALLVPQYRNAVLTKHMHKIVLRPATKKAQTCNVRNAVGIGRCAGDVVLFTCLDHWMKLQNAKSYL